MTKLKMRPMLSLLLALLMVVTMLPVSALAADLPEETAHICTDESCTHDHDHDAADVYDVQPDSDTTGLLEDAPPVEEEADLTVATPTMPEIPVEEAPVPETTTASETPVYFGHIGNSAVEWELDPASGRLFISGSGYVDPFYSPDEQPWHEVREQITTVRFELSAELEIYDLCYWFDGCVNLSNIAVPVYVSQICPSDFAGCDVLRQLTYGGVDVLEEITADYSNQPDSELTHDEAMDGGIMLFSSSNCGVLQCTCTGSCQWGYRNYRVAPESNNYHIMTVYCITCGKTDGIIVSGSHSYSSNGYCSLCGYYNSAYDQTAVCYHKSTYKSWSGCNWTEYCSSCGAYIRSGTSHGSTYTTWSGCNWYDYCRDCGKLMASGVSHSYSYGSWEYYNTSQHRRTGTCTSCGATTYSYGNHSSTAKYAPYSSTQHSYGQYCSACASYIGSVSYVNHSFSYGAWQNYSETQHRRLKNCSTCGYSEYEYSSHSLSYGAWVSISDTQHQRTNTCSCGYSKTEIGTHTDTDNDGCCDDCEYLMTRFSVTIPASLSLIVSKTGAVYSANNATIVNNSTGAVEVTVVEVTTANGWTLVPYSTNMANAKVDTRLIGFALNGAATVNASSSENLTLPGNWSITKGGSLPLTYDAVVSAMSEPVSEQVLTIVFVLGWAVR